MSNAVKIFNAGVDFEARGDIAGAVNSFMQAFVLEPTRAEFRTAALKYLEGLGGYRTLPRDLVTALEVCAADPTIDLQALSVVLRNLFEDLPELNEFAALCSGDDMAFEDALRTGKFTWLLTHTLFLAMLRHAINVSRSIEIALTQLRRKVCLDYLDNVRRPLLTQIREFFVAVVQQCIASGFVWVETAEEALAVERLRGWTGADTILIRSAYRPLSELTANEASELPPELQMRWHAVAREREIMPALPQLTPVAPGLSVEMRTQYEKFPYPRWLNVESLQPRTFARALRDAMPGMDLPNIPDDGLNMLIAGCGTGKSAASFAQQHKGAHITAVDISRTSLAYAARMAETRHIKNVDFAVADIMYMGSLESRYNVIDCSGVLHHLEDPVAGLKSLRVLLAPGGLMRLAFYSRRGRAAVAAARSFIAEKGWTDAVDDMRAARQALLNLEGHPSNAVIRSADFFNLDGLHDFLFNIHEQCYTPAEIKEMMRDIGLRVVGVDTPNLAARAVFIQEHPNPADLANLDLWESFETRFPQTFESMISIWCLDA